VIKITFYQVWNQENIVRINETVILHPDTFSINHYFRGLTGNAGIRIEISFYVKGPDRQGFNFLFMNEEIHVFIQIGENIVFNGNVLVETIREETMNSPELYHKFMITFQSIMPEITEIRHDLKPKPHKMDVKYPHKCFGCKKDLKWAELLQANSVPLTGDDSGNIRKRVDFKNMWKSEVIEFYCCSCFRKEEYKNREDTIENAYNEFINLYQIEILKDVFDYLYHDYRQERLSELNEQNIILNTQNRRLIYEKIMRDVRNQRVIL